MAAAGSASSSSSPHPRLTALQAPTTGAENTFADGEKEALLQDADVCLAKMKGKLDVVGDVIVDEHMSESNVDTARKYIAAALALLCAGASS